MSMMTAMVRRYLQLLLFAGATIVATWPQVAPAHHRFSQEQCALLESKIDALRFVQVALGDDNSPTYQFTPGVAETSLASHAAARLGVTGDQLLSLIERNIEAAKRS